MASCQVKANRNLTCSSCDNWIDFTKFRCVRRAEVVRMRRAEAVRMRRAGGENEQRCMVRTRRAEAM